MKRALIVLSLLTTPAVAGDPPPAFCSLKGAELAASTNCLRYFMECTNFDPDKLPPQIEGVPRPMLHNIMVGWAAQDAARTCTIFSYQEAVAAMTVHHRDEK